MRSVFSITACLLLISIAACNPANSDQHSANTQTQDSSRNPEAFGPEPWPPSYPGGGDSILLFVTQNLVYPKSAKRDGIEGIVHVGFWVDTDGSTSDYKIARGIRRDLDSAALTVIKQLPPKWKAGTMNGKPISMQVTIPVHFRLD